MILPDSPSIKAVFFDIDGTLVSFKTGKIPSSTIRALSELKKRNIKIIVATGRSVDAIQHITSLNFDGFITFNGGCCVSKKGDILFREAINKNDITSLVQYADEHPLNYSLMYFDKVMLNDTTPEVIGMYAHLNLPVPPIVRKNDIDIDNVLQTNIFLGPEEENEFMRNIMPNCIASRWTPLFADVNPKGITKKLGVDYFCQYFGIDISETMSFGDGGNDISMIKHTKIGVAMGKANDNVKEIADYITDDVDEDGIENALIHFKVIS
ncbi:Cof-type HAD-IIB family hydrolase [Chryseobacterium fistulae]|uniref:Bifunctional phosphatase/peptidyl-prolyl cis-trans isomerase n=1 Tax=Chryseobacterium fistulae TaxID=2675058 RepID=A0A6N4XSR3_9FLAO|nr:Cof-type HAD-IIB family hydrolase [Chryseobacterium fistulae]CAA7392445.1 Putative bifunctional phosphatase/peptidyl-prolyl cis-trans isomerase [Chryseobacterium fistulae]